MQYLKKLEKIFIKNLNSKFFKLLLRYKFCKCKI